MHCCYLSRTAIGHPFPSAQLEPDADVGAAAGAALIALLWAGNRLKVAILNEVLVFSDIFLAGHALRYPRLYFGYAPKWVWPVVIAGGAALGWCLTIEAPMNVLTDGERLGFVGLWLGGGRPDGCQNGEALG